MRKANVYTSYAEWDDHSLATLAGRTLTSMTDNENFTDPRPSIEDYADLVNDYREKQEIASNRGSQLQLEARNNAKKLVLQAMKELAFYVNVVADGDAEILASSGFVLIPPPKPAGVPRIPKNVKLIDGPISGELRLMFGVVRNAKGYEYIYASDLDENGEPNWGELQYTGSSRTNNIRLLTPGSICYVRVRARNNKGVGDWSETVSIIVR